MSTALQPGGRGPATVPIPAERDPRILVDATRDRHPRWRPGERLEHLFEQRCDRLGCGGDRPVVRRRSRSRALTYAEVDARANQLARHLLVRGTGPGHRVALLFDDPVQAYVGDARRAQGRRRLRAARPRLPGRPHRLHRVGRRGGGRAVGVAPALLPGAGAGGGRGRRRDGTADRRAEPYPGDRPGARAGARRAGLHHLHLRLHGPAEGRGGRAREHRQLRPGGRRGVRLPAGRPRLPGPDARLRLLRRGDLGALGGRRDARAEAPGRQPARRRPARVPHRAPGHRDVLRADAAGHPRGRPPRAALPAGVGRGLPARPRPPLAPARPAVPQRLRPDRGDRQRDLGRRRPGPAGDDRRAAADLLGGDPRPRRPGPRAAARAGRRARHRRRSGWRAATSTATTSPSPRSSPTFSVCRATPRAASTARATSPGSPPTARSSTSAASTCRSRSAATASS